MGFVVDCKTLAEVACGRCPLAAPGLASLFNRVTLRLFELMDTVWIPHTAISDPILLRRREHNQIADFSGEPRHGHTEQLGA